MRRTIFIGGTASNVGKSWMTTALCRLLYNRGFKVAPFKAQNMSNNSYPCPSGGEIGRSQVTQAEACGLAPEPAMNPVLLKPCGDSRSQVILNGKVWKTLDARDYYNQAPYLHDQALKALQNLQNRFEVVVMEGAGSIAELNLAQRDFVNLNLAHEVNARALLVADIERGGVFASLLGTLDLLPKAHRALIKAFAINSFRGDLSLFEEGVQILEERAQLPCLGVFPYAPQIHLDPEDSLSTSPPTTPHNIAIIHFPRLSNSTDFRLLSGATWLTTPTTHQFDFIILPGTKSTLLDLAWLRENRLDGWIKTQHQNGAKIIAICGGYQMLGDSIADPNGYDGMPGIYPGLGLIPAHTTMHANKTTRAIRAYTGQTSFDAYEIHLGITTHHEPPFAHLEDGTPEGLNSNRILGTYLHGALESPALFTEVFGFAPPPLASPQFHLDALASWLEVNSNSTVLSQLLD